jgi:hypothetical protein
MVNNDSVSGFEATATGALGDDLAAGLMTSYHTVLIALRAFPGVFLVDGANIRTTNGRAFYFDKNFSMAGDGNIERTHFDCAVSG